MRCNRKTGGLAVTPRRELVILVLCYRDFAATPQSKASASYVAAYVYQELMPEKTEVFVKNAYEMAHSREILGVHFPSDSEAGRVFARQFVNELLKNDAFKRDFEEVKREIDAVKKVNN
jgi:acid phosphatase (class A)